MRVLALLLVGCAAAPPLPSATFARPEVHAAPSGPAAAESASAPEAPATAEVSVVAPPRPPLGGGLVVTGATRRPMLLFTFDDGPDPRATPAILDTLDAHGVRAVFFVVPNRLAADTTRGRSEAELLREIVRRGHIVGSHSMRHRHLHRLDPAEVRAEIEEAEAAIAAVLGERPWLFRPPGGARSRTSDALLRERGYTQMLWDVITADFTTEDPDVVVRAFTRSLRGRIARGSPGGVVLLHDTHPWTVEALPQLLAFVEEENCRRLVRGEDLIDPSPDPGWFVVPAGDASAETSAPPASPPEEAYAVHQTALVEAARARCP
jgi:peptidoglycan/xylan/chitin deacetylase (PgdA/CDA1 family)